MGRALGTLSCSLIATLTAAEARAAAPSLTIEDAIRLALAQTTAVVQARSDLLLVDVERARALSAILPRFDLILTAGEQFSGAPIIETRNQMLKPLPGELPRVDTGPFLDAQAGSSSQPSFTVGLSGQQLIYDGGKWWLALESVGVLEVQAKALIKATENEVRAIAVRRFYELEKSNRTKATYELQSKADEEQLRRVEAMVQTGMGRPSDIAAADRNVAEDQIAVVRAEYAAGIARRALNLALGQKSDTAFELSVPPTLLEDAEPAIAIPSLDELKKTALAERPELAVGQASLELERTNVATARASYWPVVSLAASYSRQSRKPERVFGDPTENYLGALDLVLAWNLFAGHETDSQVARGEIRLQKAEVAQQELERQVLAEVEDRAQAVRILLQVYTLAKRANKSAKVAADNARGLYEQGRGTLLELRDAELRSTIARLATIEARLDLEPAVEDLNRAVGGSLHPR